MRLYTLVLLLFIGGCSNHNTGGAASPTEYDSKTIGSALVRTICYDGILYFTVWNNNVFTAPFISGAKIDPKTLKPQVCQS